MAETIGQLALRIADGMPECCNDQSGFGRIYEFEPQELETFAQVLVAQGVPDGWKLVIDPSRDCVLSNDDFHEAEIIEMGKRLFSAVDAMCAQAGTETNETVEWLCGEYGGMAKLFLKYFSPAAPAQGQEAAAGVTTSQMDAIEGAMCFGAKGINPPPAGHWLERAWIFGRDAFSQNQGQEADQKDAERYRWPRNRDVENNLPRGGLFIGRISENTVVTGEDADAAIDDAIAAQEGGAV